MRLERYLIAEAKQIFYHGTSSKLSRSILKKGFIADPKVKVWDVSKGSKESYPGTYFSTNSMTAISAATNAIRKLGGFPVVFVAQIETRTTLIDEDYLTDIMFFFNRILNVNMNQWLASEIVKVKGKYRKEIDKAIDEWIKYYNEYEIESGMPQISSQHARKLRKPLEDWLWAKMELIGKEGEYAESQNKTTPELRKATANIIEALGNISKMRNRILGNNIRMTQPITFRGANRILAAIGLPDYMNNDKDIKTFEVYYGSVPSDFFKQWKERFGHEYEIKKGKLR